MHSINDAYNTIVLMTKNYTTWIHYKVPTKTHHWSKNWRPIDHSKFPKVKKRKPPRNFEKREKINIWMKENNFDMKTFKENTKCEK